MTEDGTGAIPGREQWDASFGAELEVALDLPQLHSHSFLAVPRRCRHLLIDDWVHPVGVTEPAYMRLGPVLLLYPAFVEQVGMRLFGLPTFRDRRRAAVSCGARTKMRPDSPKFFIPLLHLLHLNARQRRSTSRDLLELRLGALRLLELGIELGLEPGGIVQG